MTRPQSLGNSLTTPTAPDPDDIFDNSDDPNIPLGGVERALGSASGPLTPERTSRVRRPGPWVTAGALNGMAIGLLWLMVNKPGWTHAIVAMAVTAFLGGVIASMVVRSGR